jgi:hypothetical protein
MTSGPELNEKDFIKNGSGGNPFPPWLWLAIFTIAAALIWGGKDWFMFERQEAWASGRFMDVTNRDFSLFLWQNPEYMRINVSGKQNYLEGFQYLKKVTVEPEMADKRVMAPPKVVFLYHVWSRLLGGDFIPRKIGKGEFNDFLNYCEEWKPQYWPQAPNEYVAFVKDLPNSKEDNFDNVPASTLPVVVKQAFVGWKNYILEGEAINMIAPTYGEMQDFLKAHPMYARNYWRNIQGGEESKYLRTLSSGTFDPKAVIPKEELAGFLKVAFYNYKQSLKKS